MTSINVVCNSELIQFIVVLIASIFCLSESILPALTTWKNYNDFNPNHFIDWHKAIIIWSDCLFKAMLNILILAQIYRFYSLIINKNLDKKILAL